MALLVRHNKIGRIVILRNLLLYGIVGASSSPLTIVDNFIETLLNITFPLSSLLSVPVVTGPLGLLPQAASDTVQTKAQMRLMIAKSFFFMIIPLPFIFLGVSTTLVSLCDK